MHILPNISRSKDNQTMEISQLIEYNMRNIFLEKSHAKYSAETNLGPFYKTSKLSLSFDQQSELLYLLYIQSESCQNISKLRCWPVAFTLFKAFLKIKKRSATNRPASFSALFLKKNISHVIFYQVTKFHYLTVFTSRHNGQYVYCNQFLSILWRHKF